MRVNKMVTKLIKQKQSENKINLRKNKKVIVIASAEFPMDNLSHDNYFSTITCFVPFCIMTSFHLFLTILFNLPLILIRIIQLYNIQNAKIMNTPLHIHSHILPILLSWKHHTFSDKAYPKQKFEDLYRIRFRSSCLKTIRFTHWIGTVYRFDLFDLQKDN